MNLVGIAAIIAAVAFAVLVLYLCKVLVATKDVLSKVGNATEVITKDVDQLSIEVEGLVNKVTALVDDVNGKLEKTDPLFTAIGDVGTSVSDIQASTRRVKSTLSKGSIFKNITPFKKDKQQTPEKPAKATTSTKTVASKTSKSSTLNKLTQTRPSQTAGEITIKKRG